jgi:hypothetical protein
MSFFFGGGGGGGECHFVKTYERLVYFIQIYFETSHNIIIIENLMKTILVIFLTHHLLDLKT